MTNGVAVKILGKDYQVACPEDQTHALLEAALMLDNKMKQIRASGRIIGLERIAVMAALNLAYELQTMQAENKISDERLTQICAKIDESFSRSGVTC